MGSCLSHATLLHRYTPLNLTFKSPEAIDRKVASIQSALASSGLVEDGYTMQN
jgi:hypothetical protein